LPKCCPSDTGFPCHSEARQPEEKKGKAILTIEEIQEEEMKDDGPSPKTVGKKKPSKSMAPLVESKVRSPRLKK